VRGFVDAKAPLFQLRIEREVSMGITWTNVWAHPETHRMLKWQTIPITSIRRADEGVVDMDPRLVRAAYEKAAAEDAECLDIVTAWLNPEPPDRPVCLVS
jgi:hypothetical protein